MAWVKKNKDGTEYIIGYISKRPLTKGCFIASKVQIELPQGSIKKLIGRELKWEDEPVELK